MTQQALPVVTSHQPLCHIVLVVLLMGLKLLHPILPDSGGCTLLQMSLASDDAITP